MYLPRNLWVLGLLKNPPKIFKSSPKVNEPIAARNRENRFRKRGETRGNRVGKTIVLHSKGNFRETRFP